MSRETLLDANLQLLVMGEDENAGQLTDASSNARHLTIGSGASYVADSFLGRPVIQGACADTAGYIANDTWLDNLAASSSAFNFWWKLGSGVGLGITNLIFRMLQSTNLGSIAILEIPRETGSTSEGPTWLYRDLFGYWRQGNNSPILTQPDIAGQRDRLWNNLTWQRSAANPFICEFWINGALAARNTTSASSPTSPDLRLIESTSGTGVAGCVSQFAAWDRNLTAAELQWLANPANTLGQQTASGGGASFHPLAGASAVF